MDISEDDVKWFKESACKENDVIARLIRDHFIQDLQEVILDVGAGAGDIARNTFASKRTILLDIFEYGDSPVLPNHQRITRDFFEFTATEIGSVVFCHSLQFLDSDPTKLQQKIAEIRPKAVLTVTNTNQDALGSLIAAMRADGHRLNPEEEIEGFPPADYAISREVLFGVPVQCASYKELSDAMTYLFDAPSNKALGTACEIWLSQHLSRPTLLIEQSIRLFQHASQLRSPVKCLDHRSENTR